MGNLIINGSIVLLLLTASLSVPVAAQRGAIRTDTRMLYHNGPVMTATSNVYVIWYGNWNESTPTYNVLTEFITHIGGSPYARINTTYPNSGGVAPSGGLIVGGMIGDAYSHGASLTVGDVEDVVTDSLDAWHLPVDPRGIYVVIGSADITDIRQDGTFYCTPGNAPLHGSFEYMGMATKYAYLGSANRCPASVGGQFMAPNGGFLPTPNNNFEADAMASTFARILNVVVTNPVGTGWFDRYGLENSDKCIGQFGATYTSANGARANTRLGQRDFLIQQNWVNDRRGRCALSYP